MADNRLVFDVSFEDQSLGLTFLPYNDNQEAVVDGFYQLNNRVLQAEESTKVALFDRVVAVQGKTVEGYDFNKVLNLLHTKKRPIRITFERTPNGNSADISWNEVLSNANEMCVYAAFLRRKGAYLCSIWMGFLREMEELNYFRKEDRSQRVKRLIHDYISEDGAYTRYMFYVPPLPVSKLVDAKNMEYCLHNLKIQLRDRVRELTWRAFMASPEYQFLRLNMKTVLYDHHCCNVFLAYLISRSSYRELALWMDIHYRLMPLLKQTHYPESVEGAYEFYMMNPCLPNDDEETSEEFLQSFEANLGKCALFVQTEAILKTKAHSYLASTDAASLVKGISADLTQSGVSGELTSSMGGDVRRSSGNGELTSSMVSGELTSSMVSNDLTSSMTSVDPAQSNANADLTSVDLRQSLTSVDGEEGAALRKRQSESSVISVDDPDGTTHCAYSDEEMKRLSSMLECLSRQHFEGRPLRALPELYYAVVKEVVRLVSVGIYLDSVTVDLLVHVLACAQMRLFHRVLNFYYHSFVRTDFFEYLVSEIRCPRDSTMSFARLRKATQYTMDRLQSCEEEVPHLRKFIQEYSENAMDLLDTQLPSSTGSDGSDVESSVEAALRPVGKSSTRLAMLAKLTKSGKVETSKPVKTETPISGKTETSKPGKTETEPLDEMPAPETPKTESEAEAPLEKVRTQMVESFRRVDLLDLINYIHKQRKFSVHQRAPPASSVHLRQFKRQSVFKAVFYRGDEATQSVREVDAVETDLTGTGLSPPSNPLGFFLPEGYCSFGAAHDARVFTFLLGSTSSERWSAACLNVFYPQTVGGSVRFVPEGLILLSPFNNLAALRDRLLGFLRACYDEFHGAAPEQQHALLLSLLRKEASSNAKRRFSAALFQCADRRPAGSHFLFSDSEDEALLSASPAGSPKRALSPTLPAVPAASAASAASATSGASTMSALSALPALPPRGEKTPDIPRVHLRSSSSALTPPEKAFARGRESSPLQLLFELLSVEHVLLLVRLLLLERSVLFVSSQLSLLTTVMEALKDLLRPFVWSYTYCPVLTRAMMNFINSPMPYMMGAHSSCVSRKALERLKGVTVVNVDEDHVALPRDLQDYYAFAPDVLGFPAASPIPKERRDSVLPPLPFVPDVDLYSELRRLVHPALSFADSASFVDSRFDAESVKELFRSYLGVMILPPYTATTIMKEKDEQIWILDKTVYLRQYSDVNSRLFMQQFIETSMFSAFYVNFYNWS